MGWRATQHPHKSTTHKGLWAARHATLRPAAWKGDRWWVVALYPLVVGDEEKYASLKREILADLGPCPY